MPQPLVWTKLKQSGHNNPVPRTGTTIVSIGRGTHVLFGGLEGMIQKGSNKSTKVGPSNQTYVLKLQADSCEWRLINQQGKIPMPRCHHIAVAISNDKMLIFGGQYTSKLRFNDTHILQTTSWKWSQPPNQSYKGNEPCNSESKIGGPPPLSHHSGVFYEGKVYVFGGQGGVDYQRRTYNDIYVLDTENFEWEKLEPNGLPPDPRGGHQASILANQKKMLIFGGWSFTSQFSNIMIYDIENNQWEDPEISHNNPKWNLCGIMAPSIPSWKYFIFGGSVGSFQEGGNRTTSKFVNDVHYLDINSLEWKEVELDEYIPDFEEFKGEKPKARENPGVLYDQQESRFIIYGGWANNWLSDVWSLNVGSITGPPYALFEIKPKQGPLTGKKKIKLFGDGFKKSENIVIRFAVPVNSSSQVNGKKTSIKQQPSIFEDVEGEYINDNEIKCISPNFEQYGPKEVEITLQINNLDYTLTGPRYLYFFNTVPYYTLVYGPGVMNNNRVGVATQFFIQARNKDNINRESGADKFLVSITRNDIRAKQNEESNNQDKSMAFTKASKNDLSKTVDVQQRNKQDISGIITKRDSDMELSVAMIKSRGFNQSGKSPLKNQLNINQNQDNEEYIDQSEFDSENEDIYENNDLVDLNDPSSVDFVMQDNEDGSYMVTYVVPEPCTVTIKVYFRDDQKKYKQVRGFPFQAEFNQDTDQQNNLMEGPNTLNFINENLEEISNFIETAKETIDVRNKNINDSVHQLIQVMQYLQKIQERKETDAYILDIVQQMQIHFQKKFDKQMNLKLTKYLQDEWTNLVKMSFSVENKIQGPKRQEAQKTVQRVKQFEEQFKSYQNEIKKEPYLRYDVGFEAAMENFELIHLELKNRKEQLSEFQNLCNVFEFPEMTEESEKTLAQIEHDLKLFESLWKQIEICQKQFQGYLQMKWGQINTAEMEDECKSLRKQVLDIKGIDRKSNVFLGIQEEIKRWIVFLPLLIELTDQAMETEDNRHWAKMKELVQNEFIVDDDLELQTIWDLKLFNFKDGIEEITDQAKQEQKMDKGLKVIIDFWQEIEFELVRHKNTEIFTLKMSEENFEQLEEHQLQINNMLLSKHIGYYENIVENWKADLGQVYDVVQLLTEVQKTWSFLENLFIQSDEVKRELPKESESFIEIDLNMKEIMAEGASIKLALPFCTSDGLLRRLEEIEENLKVCEKALMEFLDSKRRAFPRFYFVSVNDLLDILSNGNSPEKVNRHMSKIFQAIDKLALENIQEGDRPLAKEIISSVGSESVVFSSPLKLIGKVELYLKDIIQAMNQTLKDIAEKSFHNYKVMDRKTWLKQDPAQISLLVNNIMWSSEIENCFQKLQTGDPTAIQNSLENQISRLTELIKMVQGSLSKGMRQKIMCLITLDAHSRDVTHKLVEERVKKVEEFQWQSQLKFYWNDNTAQIKICDAQFWYYYEYLGNGPRLVVTPLTDRIYVTATQALHLSMGCAPAGPAGTGKTETTKDLANALAKACYVFNCSSEMNYESMGNIYKGLASSGCWGCFDEFNRLLPETLSVCSVQFKAVTDAIKRQAQKFILEGDEISLDPTCGAFITMNPGYLGRAELPEGLKTLFRPITVVVPDLELICENMLMAEGFINAKKLAKKFVTLYKLCKDLLSKQLHYDWGLRAIKSVLVVAGSFKRNEPEIAEEALLMRALRDMNLPKVAFEDLFIFYGLLGDLFPGIEIPRKRDMEFENLILEVCNEQRLFPDPEFVLKVVQLKELLEIRHSVFIIGNPGAGKSKCWQTLGKSQDKDGQKTMFVDINPKVVSTKDFYGYNLPSKEWKDGLFSNKMRSLSEMQDGNTKWLILDGDLDANWIESMNSVMDDNKILTLANNERIPLKPHMRLIFEIRDLRFASPATVSRAGILYISDDSGYQCTAFFKQWVNDFVQQEELKKSLQMLYDKYVPETLAYLKKNIKFLIPVSPISQIISLCRALQPMLEGEIKNLEYLFVYAMVWSVGGCLGEKDGIDYKKEFSNWWRQAWKSQVKFPSKGLIFEYYVDQVETVQFLEWNNKLVHIDFDPSTGQQMNNITVPTIETIATSSFIKNFAYNKHPTLLIGSAGCGKTQLAKGILKEIVKEKPDQYAFSLINFNFYTDATYLQTQLEQVLEKKAGRQFGPQGKSTMIYFIDDLNMPKRDEYDTQTAIALLRQHADYQHWYDIAKLGLKDIINTQVLAAMNPTAGSFFVNPRYQRHFWTLNIQFPENESLSQIYTTFLSGHLKKFKTSVQEQTPVIIKATLLLHQLMTSTFRKTSINFHYEFNLRHISNIFQGLLLSESGRIQEPERMLRMWIHEAERTYGDRLVSKEHLTQFKDGLYEIVKKSFGKFNFSKYFSKEMPINLIYTNFPHGIAGERYYDQLHDNKLQIFIQEALEEYNDNYAQMNLVLFEDALKHVCRICRIILPPSGHALLVGVGGSGKQSLSKLSSHIMGYSTYQITISATYNMGDLKNDLQTLFNRAGPREEGILFLFTEGQITDERFLVYINDLLSSGEIAELYTMDEKEVIINSVRTKVKSSGVPDTKDNCWNWFINQIKKNLHMSICFSPVGEMRRRCRQFPALVNCTNIDWFFPWPQEALKNVSNKFLEQVDLGENADIRKAVVEFMPYSFQVVNDLGLQLFEQEKRYAYTTPKSFLELISLFTNMLTQKREQLETQKERYEQGIIKLRDTAEQVEVEAKKKEADEFAEVVRKEKEKVEAENKKAQIEKDNCTRIKIDVTQKKAQTETDLEAAQPLIEQAIAALNSIQKKDFQTAKSYTNPPSGVGEVFSACMWMLSGFWPEAIECDKLKRPKNYDFKYALKMMKNPEDFLQRLVAFKDTVDQNLVPAYNVNFIKQNFLTLKTFDPQIIQTKSKAAKGICEWVINIVQYWDVIQEVEPKRKALKESMEQLELATIKLNEVEEIVKEKTLQLKKLREDFEAANEEKNKALEDANRCARRLDSAQRLIKALGSEDVRWNQSILQLENQLELIIGDVLISSSFVSYSGPFNKKFRNLMIQENFIKFINEQKIPISDDPNPVKILTDESDIAVWNKQHLPTDQVSVENGTILVNSQRYPLMVDPQLQGITWIKEKEKNNNLKTLRIGTKNLNRDLEQAVENGWSVLIENMDERIDAMLMPVIARQYIKRGKNKIIKFAGKDLILSSEFRLFLHTKLSNPHYPPEVQAEAALINFTVTEVGLADQLLTLVVSRERPDLAQQKVQLITQQNDFKIELKSLEDGVLYKLATATGDILDNQELIDNLEKSKALSTEISEKVAIAKITEAKINETSENYRPVAQRGALLYFLLSDLNKIHTFYKYSLEAFINVLNRAIDSISENKMYPSNPEALMDPYTGKEDEEEVILGQDSEEENEDEEEEDQDQDLEENNQNLDFNQGDELMYQDEESKNNQNQGEKLNKENDNIINNEDTLNQNEQENLQGEEEEQLSENQQNVSDKKQKVKFQLEGGKDQENTEQNKDQQQYEEEIGLTPRSMKKRVNDLIEVLTYTAFHYTRRGLFERHKLVVATMLALRVLQRDGKLTSDEVDHLVIGKLDANALSIPDSLKNFINIQQWQACKAIEKLENCENLCSSIESDLLQWKKWYSEEKAESQDLPRSMKHVTSFQKLVILRALRPDRLPVALGNYIKQKLGEQYIEQPAFHIEEVFQESTCNIPIFFVLFPGVDPTKDVEKIGARYDVSSTNGRFVNISMGQGQEERARKAIYDCAAKGKWIMLQNLHLMQSWLYGISGLEGFLDQVFNAPSTKKNFRVFLSSEPPPLSDMVIMPESVLQSSIKVSNEAPQYLKANLRRAYNQFSQEFLERCEKKKNEIKSCLFALCFFHSIILGRKKFGSQGWSRVYNFNDGDLQICGDVLSNYLNKYDQVPFDDLRYLFGEIMYGGHITDEWDRRTNRAYLQTYIVPELLGAKFNLAQNFQVPKPDKFDYQSYLKYIEENLPNEIPQMYGMHPNAEIGQNTIQNNELFSMILNVSGGSKKGGNQSEEKIMELINHFLTKKPKEYNIFTINEKIQEKTPFTVVCLQEIERMNNLLIVIKTSLEELKMGLNGALNMTDSMETLIQSLQFNQVPQNWQAAAYFSKKNLQSWYLDLIERNNQLLQWTDNMQTPYSLCISYLFNPMSFITAVMQVIARQQNLPLDNMVIQTNVTLFKEPSEVTGPAEQGAYIHGFYLEGAAWEIGSSAQQTGYLVEQRSKELHPKMPVINIIAVPVDQKKTVGQYRCPVYVTSDRGPTYVFPANLQMESDDQDEKKWILSGTCLLMSDD
ncbi:P-loop containing nucleoside triphosphate hydrolase [Pseudocohnilembus persalinus]|uniref:p-loop containing nucleoside triphosphate hydrolase n=1 Tax=Pseudocohnilembus persalinus TaxID=266149 RepID=A0A0V0Q8N5_PSEPJ|nr:P-loop containing nucleoside triphosphate hydrolase [Pseudocohnilembus persalinus]|eukprot:KRW98533.1 P-loop containing nucleoside triphosphate hydrolase [Pseudocohnilembus persalinus]